MIRCQNVEIKVHGLSIVRNVNFSAQQGEVVCLLGPNGAGKSTLLKALSGDLEIHEGSAEFDGVKYEHSKAHHYWACRRATLPQQSSLSFPFQVQEVVMLGRTPHNTGVKRDAEITRQVMEQTDIYPLKDRIYTELSGGEKQRVQLARVFAQIHREDQESTLLLLDEPTSALDLAHQKMILQQVKSMAQAHSTVVMVLHDLNLAARFADRILLMNRGEVRYQGSPQEVLTEGIIGEVFDVEVMVTQHPEHHHPVILLR